MSIDSNLRGLIIAAASDMCGRSIFDEQGNMLPDGLGFNAIDYKIAEAFIPANSENDNLIPDDAVIGMASLLIKYRDQIFANLGKEVFKEIYLLSIEDHNKNVSLSYKTLKQKNREDKIIAKGNDPQLVQKMIEAEAKKKLDVIATLFSDLITLECSKHKASVIKEIPGRIFNWDSLKWEIPLSSFEVAKEILDKNNLTHNLDEIEIPESIPVVQEVVIPKEVTIDWYSKDGKENKKFFTVKWNYFDRTIYDSLKQIDYGFACKWEPNQKNMVAKVKYASEVLAKLIQYKENNPAIEIEAAKGFLNNLIEESTKPTEQQLASILNVETMVSTMEAKTETIEAKVSDRKNRIANKYNKVS